MFGFPSCPLIRAELEGRGYLGVGGQRVLVLRAAASKLRPIRAARTTSGSLAATGIFAASRLARPSATRSLRHRPSLRAPLSSPLRVAKLGVNIFVDTGVTYNKGQRLTDQPFETGTGAGVWLSAAVVQLHLEVAHGFGAGTRAHFGMGFTFLIAGLQDCRIAGRI